ncbi:hypothetical protein EGO53_28475 (plasmid) [Serratia liquefaciens]|uniref:Fimbrial protein n=1 Tax=Serratia liquefaciens TaxID=614 RepID=A0A515D5N9_SERLI|nr:hypothetical protein EGO53_28475 [Serratia liquefaciens]
MGLTKLINMSLLLLATSQPTIAAVISIAQTTFKYDTTELVSNISGVKDERTYHGNRQAEWYGPADCVWNGSRYITDGTTTITFNGTGTRRQYAYGVLNGSRSLSTAHTRGTLTCPREVVEGTAEIWVHYAVPGSLARWVIPINPIKRDYVSYQATVHEHISLSPGKSATMVTGDISKVRVVGGNVIRLKGAGGAGMDATYHPDTGLISLPERVGTKAGIYQAKVSVVIALE